MEKSIGRLISILHRQSQIYFNQALREFHITSAEYAFLLYLYRNNGITQDDLSKYLYIDKSLTARSIKSLEQKGYIIRKKDEHDKRFNRVYVTKKAEKNCSKIRKRVYHWSELLTAEMDETTVDIVYAALETMVNKVEQLDFKKETEDTKDGI